MAADVSADRDTRLTSALFGAELVAIVINLA